MLNYCPDFFSLSGFGMMGLGSIFWLFVLLLGGVLLWQGINDQRQTRHQENNTKQEESAFEILLKEYARGGISEAEFLQKKQYIKPNDLGKNEE